ncbi:uncharacterized protein N7477_003715 [Penicillium maclennaniae]|uniref:uncharacterized protein n=1 Tax=Penicillium maclennaniae TaxID=1343394 RepID=UPI00254007F8|nr:uncharacterized protein N7477_003715 [Penicillium maclennaniae]KAJ5678082.1 hypothetical protein N7477_003715 [Penicillium maclennaniae]
MTEIFLDRALGLLASEKQKDRSDGLADLKHILQQNKQSSKLLDLNDKACFKIFETLFRLVASEKSGYARAQRSNSKSPSTTRLSACASVIRIAVDTFLQNIRIKTVRAVIEHILETIPIPGEGLWELMSVDYTKCLTSLLRYPPHTEHLGDADWEKLIEFCLTALRLPVDDESQFSIRSGYRSAAEDTSDGHSTPARMTPAPAARERSVGDRTAIGEVVESIQLLTASPSAPTQLAAENILHGLVEYVKSSSTVAGNAHQLAFNSINTVVARVMFDQSQMVQSALLRLIPVIRRIWVTKLQSLKDELLVTLMHCTALLADAAQKDPSEPLERSIEGLISSLFSEYVRRPEKELLQVDDVVFHEAAEMENRQLYGPRLGYSRSEHNWSLIWVIASFLKLLEDISARPRDPDSLREASGKRQRLHSRIEDIFLDAISAIGARKICALQLVPFLEQRIDLERKESFIRRLTPNIMDDNGAVSSWTMIALASIATGPDSKATAFKGHWPRAVDLAARAFSSSVTSRAACKLMSAVIEAELLNYSTLTEITRSMLSSAGLNGPSAVSDTSLGLWALIARKRSQICPGSAQNASKQICSWLREAWTIGSVTDRFQTAQVALYARPFDLLNLFMACTNRSFSPPRLQETGPTGPVARAWLFLYENQGLLEYLFNITPDLRNSNPWSRESSWRLESSTRQDADDLVIIDLLRLKSDIFLQNWNSCTENRSLHVTTDILQILTSFCTVSTLFGACLPLQLEPRMIEIRKNCLLIWNGICEFFAAHGSHLIQPCLETIMPFISSAPKACTVAWTGVLPLAAPLAKVLEGFRKNSKQDSTEIHDLMDSDDRLTAQGDQLSTDQSIISMNREFIALFRDTVTFQRCITIQLSILLKVQPGAGSQVNYSPDIIEYLTSFNEADLLSAKHILPDVYRSISRMDQEGLLCVLEDLGERCLQSYEMERCEASHGICISMMSGFVASWTDEQNRILGDSAMDLYSWFMEALLARKRASPRTYIVLSELIEAVLDARPSYGSEQSLPSPRTSLFTILHEGDIQVKFSVAGFIPSLFQRFLLKDHDAIFDDVLGSLPRDPDWVEGIALRLFVLSKLASDWHTLLRRCIYHMFETPAQVPASLEYAQKCMRSVSNALGLRDATELFRLFASQILYTWTETQTVTSMPFSIFEYENLKELLLDVKDEVVGQIMMRAKESELQELASYLQIPFAELLETSFHKAEAYCIARDITTPPEPGSQPKGVEVRMRKLLGADSFMKHAEMRFPEIIAIFFKSLDRHDQVERAFSKRPNFQYALIIHKKIVGKGAAQSSLPANQQPSFRARYLLDELDFLCKRVGFELESIWTPVLASFVSRSLLETIHPALGSLHTCSAIRKIRILVCLCGPVMLEGYPFEMLLHALRPFLSDIHCSEDALGIFWYLLEAGKGYLMGKPELVAGICITTFLTLRKFYSSSLSSTTQHSQFESALTNAEKFHPWLCQFAEECRSSDWDHETQEPYSRMLNLAEDLSAPDRPRSGPSEKDLVLEVLEDQAAKVPLLQKPIADLVLSLLCPEFKQVKDDAVRSSDKALDADFLTVSLWRTLHKFNGGLEYRLWAARVIGRSFASSGKINESLLREQDLWLFNDPVSIAPYDAFCFSKTKILQVLCDKLQIQDHLETGLIERTLQVVLSNITDFPDVQGCAEIIPESILPAFIWNPYACPQIPLSATELELFKKSKLDASGLPVTEWARGVSLSLSSANLDDPVLGPLRKVLAVIPDLAVQMLPYIVHDALLVESDKNGPIRQSVSNLFKRILSEANEETIAHAQLVISCILYLRNQPMREESTIVDRDRWLDIDYGEASSAAHRCGLQKTSLLFLEIEASRIVSGSRRSSVAKYEPPIELLHDIFKNIDDPDLFYGIQQSSSLITVMERLEYESSGFKNLLFQSAQYDSEVQLYERANPYEVLKALNSTNLRGIANTMRSAAGISGETPLSFDSTLQAATSLQQWEVPVSPSSSSPSATVFRVFQSLASSSSLSEVNHCIDECLLSTLNSVVETGQSAIKLRTSMRALGIMTEIRDILDSSSPEAMQEAWETITARSSWLKTESYHEVGDILSWHEALFSSIRKHDFLRSKPGLSAGESRLLEANVFRQSLEITRNHGVSQASLKSAITLSKLAESCAELGVDIEGAAKFDLANVLWDQGEMTASIRMLQHLKGQGDLHRQAIPISRAELLVTLGDHVAEARLEKPESILQDYLYPAVKELKGTGKGEEAGRVYHGFATFCDQQLLNPDGLEDFKRVEQLRDRKEKEMQGLEDMMKTAEGRERESLKIFRAKTKQWFDLDDREYQRLLRSREAFLQQCLENYLLALRESDAYNNDALRFCALWLDKSDSNTANMAVKRYLSEVPSRKFAPLMNQLSSRLLDVSDEFQSLLTGLVFKICAEHPFHGMYQIFASSKSKGGKDPSSHSRFRAANKLVDKLKNDKEIGATWIAVHNMNITFVRFAIDKPDSKYKTGAKIPLKKLSTGNLKSPSIQKFLSEFTIASGVSAPKIVTCIATNGERYKQLYKGGNDDLRQDAIMEQVFEQVSSLLKDHQPTRQRKLGIRTYKVLPLTLNAGIIEFVPNTIPLHDYLMPAHQRYFPKDMKPNACRKHIADVQTRSFEQRVRTYRQVTEHFHPVMRYFFMEKFNNPDDWFSKRLSYTRSTAAISILGHVLGLGDRHGHNILLDERTGEVVHIDLGVAFEQGRILPIPEVVPFRLTRDLVDGFGITKTEGVFRRCCEFTLEALRQESYSIMTILDKMQDNQGTSEGPPVLPGAADKSSTNEPSEADRALTVVAKKLSKTLSVTATVNELIQQATDEKNLAVLYCGWAAYA